MNQRGQTFYLGSDAHTITSLTPEEAEELKGVGDFPNSFGVINSFRDMAAKQV